MKLSDKQQNKIKQFLNERWHEPRSCTVCKETDLTFSDTLFSLAEFNPDNLFAVTTEIPVVALVCSNCGNVTLFNAIVMGIEIDK